MRSLSARRESVMSLGLDLFVALLINYYSTTKKLMHNIFPFILQINYRQNKVKSSPRATNCTQSFMPAAAGYVNAAAAIHEFNRVIILLFLFFF